MQQLINYRSHETFFCLHLGALGFATKLIERRTGLSHSQISYRLHRAGIRLRDYREGTTPIAQIVIDKTEEVVTKRVLAKIRSLLESKGVIS